jgi:hypothetical protein
MPKNLIVTFGIDLVMYLGLGILVWLFVKDVKEKGW